MYKYVFSLVTLSFFLLSSTAYGEDNSTNSICGMIATQSSPLNIRAKASNDGKVLGHAAKGSAVLISKLVNEDWYQVTLDDGTIGYASTEYVLNAHEVDFPFCGLITTESTKLNVRSAMDVDSEVIASVLKGTVVRVLKDMGEWYKTLLSNGHIGYVSRAYVTYPTKLITNPSNN